jgi:hypothetical protein
MADASPEVLAGGRDRTCPETHGAYNYGTDDGTHSALPVAAAGIKAGNARCQQRGEVSPGCRRSVQCQRTHASQDCGQIRVPVQPRIPKKRLDLPVFRACRRGTHDGV